eukprot:3887134-Rhodomonas_salina.5
MRGVWMSEGLDPFSCRWPGLRVERLVEEVKFRCATEEEERQQGRQLGMKAMDTKGSGPATG